MSEVLRSHLLADKKITGIPRGRGAKRPLFSSEPNERPAPRSQKGIAGLRL